jgi:hypothetical protein
MALVECVDGGDGAAGSAVGDQCSADLRERRGEVGQVVFDRDLLGRNDRGQLPQDGNAARFVAVPEQPRSSLREMGVLFSDNGRRRHETEF